MNKYISTKYGSFVDNEDGTWTFRTTWSLRNDTTIPSYRGGPAKVKVSREVVKVMGFEEAGKLAFEYAQKHAEKKEYSKFGSNE